MNANNNNTAKTNNNNAANKNTLNKKTLANIKKQATKFIGGFRAACIAILEVANTDQDAKKLCTYLGINTESIKNKNIAELRKNILARLPWYYTTGENETHYPARLQRVSSDMQAAGVQRGYIAVKDTYLNALIALGALLANGNEYTQIRLNLTETTAEEIDTMNDENTTCVVYDKNGNTVANCTEKYIKFKRAKKIANEKAKTANVLAFAEAIG